MPVTPVYEILWSRGADPEYCILRDFKALPASPTNVRQVLSVRHTPGKTRSPTGLQGPKRQALTKPARRT
jgi:hypothetical protein